jgi:hypothetical protein
VHSGDGSFIGVQRGDDEAQTGFVSIANDGKTTTIGIIVGKNLNGTPRAQATESGGGDTTDASPTESSSDSGSPSSGDSSLPDEVSLPKDYPKDRAPLPSGVRLTSASSITSGGQSLYTVEFYSKDDASEISQYFKDELPKHNWSQVLASESGGESLLSYSDGDNQSVTITIGQADVAGYQKVSMLLTV